MTTWCHQPTIIIRRFLLRLAVILVLIVALTTTIFFAAVSKAAPGSNQTISFQGRLLDAGGATVPDGYYNIQFKMYQGGSGTEAGNPDGSLVWTETHINNGSTTGAVKVKGGIMNVELGSRTPFGTSIDWSTSVLWLSMNIAGSAVNCTTFGSANCAPDGEMLPMKQLTATPFAMSAASLNGIKAENFLQLARGVQNDASTNTSSIHINKTGTGNLIQLQNTATDVFTIGNTGNITLGTNANKTISIGAASSGNAGRSLTIAGGGGGTGTGSAGGDLLLQGGAAGGTNGNGGGVQIDAGAKTGTGTGGAIAIGAANASSITIGGTATTANQTITIGGNNTAGSSSNITIGAGGSATSGTTNIRAKNSVTISTNGTTRATFSDTTNTVYFGNGVSAAAPSNSTLQGTNSTTAAVAGGSLAIQGGNATTGNTNGGNVTLSGGTGSGTGASGLVVLNTPTFSTVTNDANCYAGGVLATANCTVTQTSVNNSSAVIVGFSVTGQTATLPDPTITTAGRVLYIMSPTGSQTYTLSMNGGGTGNVVTVVRNAAVTVMWNGIDWVVAGATSSTTTQEARTANGVNFQIGDGVADGAVTLLTLDKAASAPTITDPNLVGSMYYDTTLGKLQCYEASGWSDCVARPDTFVTLIPQYAGAVVGTTGTGTFSSNFCSDVLNINDGSSSQATVCGTNETQNYYQWTPTATAQTRSIFVSYKLPASFDGFVAGSTSLKARTNNANANVTYQMHRVTATTSTACGTATTAATGVLTTWRTTSLAGTADPANCGFVAGDSVLIRINMTGNNTNNTYVSDLNFAFKND